MSDCPYFRCHEADHAECWREYERDTDAEKYRGAE